MGKGIALQFQAAMAENFQGNTSQLQAQRNQTRQNVYL